MEGLSGFLSRVTVLGSTRVVAEVNGEPVTLHEVLDRKAMLEGNQMFAGRENPSVALSDAFKMVVKAKVMIAEAKKRGITVSKAEVSAEANRQRELIKSADPEDKKFYEEQLKGSGLTEDQFWTQQEPKYESLLYAVKLKRIIVSNITVQEAQSAWNQAVDTLAANPSVRIIDSTLGLQ